MPLSLIRFEEFELDSDRYQLRRAGRPQKLERIPMEILILLVENRGRVVSREAIIDRVWGKDVFLETEHSINTAINKVRRVLRDDPGNPRFVQTVFGKGYRFLAETTVLPDPKGTPPAAVILKGTATELESTIQTGIATSQDVADETAISEPSQSTIPVSEDGDGRQQGQEETKAAGTEQPNIVRAILPVQPAPIAARKRQYRVWLLIAILVFSGLIYLYMSLRLVKRRSALVTQATSHDIRSIAVLPLANLSNNPEQEYLVDGLTDQLITDLAQATPLRVISRTSTMQYKRVHKSLPEIARDLNVDAIVEGSVLPSQGTVRITAQLLDARSDRHLWAESYERDSKDMLAMQDEVAHDIAHRITATLLPARHTIDQQYVNPEAYDKYLRGRFLWNRRTLGNIEKSIDYYRQAIQLAPDFAPAYAALGDAYAVISYRGGPPPSDSYPRAREAAEKALQLDDSLADAHALLGEVKVNYDFDWEGGEQEFQRAIALNPNYPTAHHWYAIHLALMKRPEEAEAEIDKASMLDPLAPAIIETRSEIRYWARAPDEAIRLSLHLQEQDPDFAEVYYGLGRAYELKRQLDEAQANFKKAADLSTGSPKMLLAEAHAYALAGRKDFGIATIDRALSSEHGYVANSDVGAVYCAMGEPATAMIWLEKGYANHEEGMNQLAVEPMFDGCRHDPQFQALIQRLRLPQ